jgi:hypothetical protein
VKVEKTRLLMNYSKIEIVDGNGDNMDGSKVQSRDLVAIRSNVGYYKTFIDKKMNHGIS